MMNINEKMIKALEIYINWIETLKKNLYIFEIKGDLFQNLVELLSINDTIILEENSIYVSTLLNTIYNNDILTKEFYTSILEINKNGNKSNFEKFCKKIEYKLYKVNKKIQELNNTITTSSALYRSAIYLRKCYENSIDIYNNKALQINIKEIIKFLEESGKLNSTDSVLLINEIENTRKIGANSEVSAYSEKEYSDVINLTTLGKWEHDDYDLDKTTLAKINSYVSVCENGIRDFIKTNVGEDHSDYSLNKIKNFVESSVETIKPELNENEFIYFLNSMLIKLYDEIQEYRDLLLDKDLHYDKNNIRSIINDINRYLEAYLIINSIYSNLSIKEENVGFEEISKELNEPNKNILYSLNSSLKPRLLNDLKNTSEEHYLQVQYLLDGFRNSTLKSNETKKITNNNNLNKIIELRGDQVRIVIKLLNNNTYVILGMFIKKQDLEIKELTSVALRDYPDIKSDKDLEEQLKLAKIFDREIEKFIEENKRKSNRF